MDNPLSYYFVKFLIKVENKTRHKTKNYHQVMYIKVAPNTL